MGNAFDSANYPEGEPEELVVGDRWLWKRTSLSADYPTADYSLSYVADKQASGSTSSRSPPARPAGSTWLRLRARPPQGTPPAPTHGPRTSPAPATASACRSGAASGR